MKLNSPAIEIELVRGCNMSCDFCGNFSLPKEKAYMQRSTLDNFIKRRSAKIKRIELTGRGEPLLHPEVITFIKALRVALPAAQLSLTTNGKLVNEEMVFSLYDAGLNILLIDCYNASTGKFKALISDCGFKYYDGVINPWSFVTSSKFLVYLIPDRGTEFSKDDKMKIYSRCGAVNPAVYPKYKIDISGVPLKKKCVMPFRNIFIQYDGSVTLCCMDWKGESKYADVNTMARPILDVFQTSTRLNYVRKLLLEKKRAVITPCNRCDYFGGFRQGLLPTLEEMRSL